MEAYILYFCKSHVEERDLNNNLCHPLNTWIIKILLDSHLFTGRAIVLYIFINT